MGLTTTRVKICDGSFFGLKVTGTEPTKEETDE
jgi:hypothetical protein